MRRLSVLTLAAAVFCALGTPSQADRAPRGYQLNETPHKHGFRYTRPGEPVRRGALAERFEVRDGDCGGRDCKAPRYRSEIRLTKSRTKARIGQDIWYGWSYFNETIPALADNVNLMPVVGQWKMGGDAAPVFKLTYHGARKTIEVQLDDMMKAQGWGKAQRFGHVCTLISMRATKGRWTDFVVNTNFSTGSDGYLRIWINGTLKCNYRGPLVANTSKRLYPGPNHRRGIFVSFTKRWDKVKGSARKPTLIAYFDEFLVGRARQDVDTRAREKAGLPAKD